MTSLLRSSGRSVGAAAAQYKIDCSGSTIFIGDQEFLSATDALEAYLSQYDRSGIGTKKNLYKQSTTDLLNPKSALHLTAERSLETGVRDTETELFLADTKDQVNESLQKMKKSVQLRAEAKKSTIRKQRERVEDALNKSQELIAQINSDNYPDPTECASDVGSLNTDILVSMNPAGGGATAPNWKSKHVFGYRRPRNQRAKTLSSIQLSHDMLGLKDTPPAHSYPSEDKSSPHVTFQEFVKTPEKPEGTGFDDDVSLLLGNSPDTSRISRSPDKKKTRSRSVSPSILKRERKLFESGLRDKPIPDFYTEFNTSASRKAPSWVDTMDLSDVTDTAWKKGEFTSNRPPPSWIDDIGASEITSVGPPSPIKPLKPLGYQDLLRPLPVINTQDSSINSETDTAPGLSFRDLVGDTSKLDLKNTQKPAVQNTEDLSLTSKLNNLKEKTSAALERYHERMQKDLASPIKATEPYGSDNVPRCSSLDTAALIAGIQPPGKNCDITGASPIRPRDDSFLPGATSPSKHKRPASPDTDIVLTGDRPWEKMTSYKPPVSVQDSSNRAEASLTYSGGNQPGSIEALKNMIFKLQQEAAHTDSEDETSRSKISEKVYKLRAEAADLGIAVPPTDQDPPQAPIPSLRGYNFKAEPGGHSLEKAMVHLDRLKNLVTASQSQKDGENRQTSGKVVPLCADI